MKKITLKAELRLDTEKPKILRNAKTIPWVVYWYKQKNLKIKIDNSSLLKTYRIAWENHIVSLDLEWKKIDVLFQEVQNNPITWDFLHIDFLAISAWEKVTANIPLIFIWNSKAKTEWAIIEELIKEVEVKCLPKDLVDNFEVDLTLLKEIWDNIKVWDLVVNDKIEILNNKNDVLVVASKFKEVKEEEVSSVNEEQEKEEDKKENNS